MNIGVDFDGVIIDFERHLKYEFEKIVFLTYGRDVVGRHSRRIRKCLDLTDEEVDKILEDHLVRITYECPFIAGAGEVLDMLRERGHELFLITTRNDRKRKGEISSAKERLHELGFKFDGEFWCAFDKVATCKENNITVMIDDDERNCRNLSENIIHTLYFRDKGVEKLPTGKYLVEVYNWMHIYKEILKLEEIVK